MKHFFIFLIVLGILLMIGTLFSQVGSSYKVIVNKDNPVSELTKDKVSKLFLKKAKKWDNGNKVQPVDLFSGSTVRKSFSKGIYGKTVAAIKAYWQKQIFSGKGIPPAEKNRDREVIAYVKSKPGAIGYVSAKANTNGVKVVKIAY
jgi:ABC-type phosphate transport system substrate-binding protein